MNEYSISKNDPIFEKLAKEFVVHDKGYFILAPSGVGKTYFVTNQKEKNWIDGDYLWDITGADYLGDEWVYDFTKIQVVNKRCDKVTDTAKQLGFWVIGSSNYDLKPDAIVLPHWELHKSRILLRENTAYDGGAKQKDLNGVLEHRKWIAKWQKKGVPKFEDLESATNYVKGRNLTSTKNASKHFM